MNARFNREFVASLIRSMTIKLDELKKLNEADNPDWIRMKAVQFEMSEFYFGLGTFLLDRILENPPPTQSGE